MKIYRTRRGAIVAHRGAHYDLQADWDELLGREGLRDRLAREVAALPCSASRAEPAAEELLPPVASQEVWAAGVTYLRSRTARMEESKAAGGGSFYDRVYDAERPELFLKATPGRVVGHGGEIRVRRDSAWNVPEPELAVVVSPRGEIVGYTIGNDVSSREIEGENPLYLPQAKVYDGSCALGPGVLLAEAPLPAETAIEMEIRRGGEAVFRGATTLGRMKRSPAELVEYLYRETSFPHGSVLLTGTGVIPEDSFTLRSGDEVAITIPPIGSLVNAVA